MDGPLTARQLIWIIVGAAAIWFGGRWIMDQRKEAADRYERGQNDIADFERRGRSLDRKLKELKATQEAANASAAQGY